MKCVQNKHTLEVKRVRNEIAENLVEKKEWRFVEKSVWKQDPNTAWTKAATPANPMSENKKFRKAYKENK